MWHEEGGAAAALSPAKRGQSQDGQLAAGLRDAPGRTASLASSLSPVICVWLWLLSSSWAPSGEIWFGCLAERLTCWWAWLGTGGVEQEVWTGAWNIAGETSIFGAVWLPWHCPHTVPSLTLLIHADSCASPSAHTNTMALAQGGEKVPIRGMQLFIFLNYPFGRLGSKQQVKLWLLPAPAPFSTG